VNSIVVVDHLSEEMERLLYERNKAVGCLNEVIRACWQRLYSKELNLKSLNGDGVLNTIISAQTGMCVTIAKLPDVKDKARSRA
jgi:hypothetical protein